MKIIEPQTEKEFEVYYFLRWKCLRKPWGKPIGSERDELETGSVHAMLLNEKNQAVGVGRLHLNSSSEAQIRYMATDEEQRGKRYGDIILKYLEKKAKEKGCTIIILQARENAVNFYKRNGFSVREKSFLLWDEIQHYLMEKEI